MNAVEIESAVSELAVAPFDPAEFPFAFLAAFGNKDTALKRLRAGNKNASDQAGGVLQRNHIHLAVCASGAVGDTLNTLRASPATSKAKARFILKYCAIVVPKVTSESRPYLPVRLLSSESVVSDHAFAICDAPLWNMALIA